MSGVYIGSIVLLKSGGFSMTVKDYDIEKQTIETIWFYEDELRTSIFPVAVLIHESGHNIDLHEEWCDDEIKRDPYEPRSIEEYKNEENWLLWRHDYKLDRDRE